MTSVKAPEWLADTEKEQQVDMGWSEVLEDPEEFLALGLCSRSWFERAGPLLAAAAERAPLDGGVPPLCETPDLGRMIPGRSP